MSRAANDIFTRLNGKTLLAIDYFDKGENDEDSRLELNFSDGYTLVVQTFWRIYSEDKMLAMISERYLLPNRLAPEKDYQNLPLFESLLFKNLNTVKDCYINSIVKEVTVNEVSDIKVRFENNFTVQGIINCRSNSYMYYGLFQNGRECAKIKFDWKL